MARIWDRTRRIPRGRFVIPCVLHDADSKQQIVAAILDLSADGCRVICNDSSLTGDETELIGKLYRIEFEFFNVDTKDISAKVLRAHRGSDEAHERQLGLQFTDIDPEVARQIGHIVVQNRSKPRRRALKPRSASS